MRFDLATHSAEITATLSTAGAGPIEIILPHSAHVRHIEVNGQTVSATDTVRSTPHAATTEEPDAKRLDLELPAGDTTVVIRYAAVFDDDPSVGETVGQIHNFSVSAHIGEDGIFLSDNAGWHPVWVDPTTRKRPLIKYDVSIQLIEGWSFVASGDPMPATHAATDATPSARFQTPRPIDGLAVVGNRHVVQRRTHETPFGPVELVMQTRPENESFIPLFLDEAERYLDLYTPMLGAFPYSRFTIVENFFSSGFAFPGFTVLGPRVIPMGERALAPGYLDHELLHNWWGNGIYVDPDSGNWCEALTSYCANYYRRVLDDGEEAGLEYRRGILMKLATDPETFDNAPPAEFGINPEVNRFVGYDKGSFIFMMIEAPTPDSPGTANRELLFRSLRRFISDNLGRRARWSDIRTALEQESGRPFDDFFNAWVNRRTLPTFHPESGARAIADFQTQVAPGQHFDSEIQRNRDGESWIELDPEYYLYRRIPETMIVPTIAGTMGRHGMRIEFDPSEFDGVSAFVQRMEADEAGENLLLIGRSAANRYREVLKRADDPIEFDQEAFDVGGVTYSGAGQAVLHTVHDPDHPGRFITVFLTNGPDGWSHLNYITFYSRDTTVIWDGGPVIQRSTHVPDQRYRLMD